MRVISCAAPLGDGGLGQHFAQLVDASREEGQLVRYYTKGTRPDDELGCVVSLRPFGWIQRYTPVRFSRGWTSYLEAEIFDRKVARRLDEPTEKFMGFVGMSLSSFRRATRLGVERLELVAANSHVNNVRNLHERAHRQTGVNDSWLNRAQQSKTLKEYEAADVIYVNSEYTRQTFLEEGVAPEKLKRVVYKVEPKFKTSRRRRDDDVFRVVYVGRVDATKGVPLLVDAFSSLSGKCRLTIVGGWSSRAMRKYMVAALARDPRIRCQPGDPLPVLRESDVFVHPTYEDGFAYAPMEALSCGVPVIVTEDTGMKEYVREGVNGFVVPTGSVEALAAKMRAVRHHEILI